MGFLDKILGKNDLQRTTPKRLVESHSPVCDLYAFVEQDNRVAYFYIVSPNNRKLKTKSCWICNSSAVEVKETVQMQMKAGIPPAVPLKHLTSTANCLPLDAGRLSIVWFEEGDSAALLQDETLVAVIPSWSGNNGFHGYSRDCAVECEVCWPLSDENFFHERTRKAIDFWKRVRAENFWKNTQEYFLKKYETEFGNVEKYFAIDGDKWPPKAIVSIPQESGHIHLTLGVSIICQPTVELATETPEDFRRFEFGFYASSDLSSSVVEAMLSYVSGQTTLPWSSLTWLGNGHTLGCSVFADIPGSEMTAILLSKTFGHKKQIDLSVEGDSVNLLWMVPISSNEREYSKENDSDKLLELLRQKGVNEISKIRRSTL